MKELLNTQWRSCLGRTDIGLLTGHGSNTLISYKAYSFRAKLSVVRIMRCIVISTRLAKTSVLFSTGYSLTSKLSVNNRAVSILYLDPWVLSIRIMFGELSFESTNMAKWKRRMSDVVNMGISLRNLRVFPKRFMSIFSRQEMLCSLYLTRGASI